MQVNDLTREAIGRCLPWLPELLHREISSLETRFVDMKALGLEPKGLWWHGVWRPATRILLINKNGEVARELKGESLSDQQPSWLQRLAVGLTTLPSESVEQALKHCDLSSGGVFYILEVGVFGIGHTAMLYVLPEAYDNMSEWMEATKAEALVTFRESLARNKKKS